MPTPNFQCLKLIFRQMTLADPSPPKVEFSNFFFNPSPRDNFILTIYVKL